MTDVHPTVTLEMVDPAVVTIGPNIRTDAALDGEFVASIKARGVLQPIRCRRVDGELILEQGQRRTLAAIEAGHPAIPALVIDGPADRAERLVDQWVENEARADMTDTDRVGAIQQMMLEGLSVHTIARRTGTKRHTIEKAKAVAASSKAIETLDALTLDQAATLAAYEDNEADIAALVEASRRGQWDHAIRRIENRRAEEQMIAEFRAAGIADGTLDPDLLLDAAPTYYDDETHRLSRLCAKDDPNRTPLNAEDHATCLGHVMWIDTDWNWVCVDADGNIVTEPEDDDDTTAVRRDFAQMHYGCRNWRDHGHADRYASSHTSQARAADMTEAERERAKDQRARVIANNKAWPLATEVRREWLTQFATRKTAPQNAETFIAAELNRPGHGEWRIWEACQLLGTTQKALHAEAATATAKRATQITLSVIVARMELANSAKDAWRTQGEAQVAMLRQLSAWGYQLSDIEQQIVTPTTS